MPSGTLEEMTRVFESAEVFVIYGCTEISCMGTTLAVTRDSRSLRTPVGAPFPGTTLRVLDERLGEAPCGEVGRIFVASDGCVQGYLGVPELRDGREEVVTLGRSATDGPERVACRSQVDCARNAPNVCVAVVATLEEWTVRTLDARTGKMGATLVCAHRMGAHLSSDGKMLAVDDDDGRLSLVKVSDSSSRQLTLDAPVFVLDQSFTPDGKRLLFVGADRATWGPRLGTVDFSGHVEIAFGADDVQIDVVVTSDDGRSIAAALRKTDPPALTMLEVAPE